MSDIKIGTKVKNKQKKFEPDIKFDAVGVVSRVGGFYDYEVDFEGEDRYGFDLKGVPMFADELEVADYDV